MTRTLVSNQNENHTLTIHQWIILRNGWEYYVTEKPDSDGIGEALVLGFENEIGSFSLDEIKPYVLSSAVANELLDLAPPDGWHWQ